jgi:hypothetical protein
MLIGWFSTLSKNGYCGQLFFPIGWKFKLILIRNHMCDRTAVFQVNGRRQESSGFYLDFNGKFEFYFLKLTNRPSLISTEYNTY